MNNSQKIILDLCGGTGAWSKPYRDNGYKVHNITLPYYDILKTEFKRDSDMIIQGGEFGPIEFDCSQIYGILAAPPCKVFSIAAWKIPVAEKDFRTGMKIVRTCVDIIWECQCNGGQLKFWALENPRGHLRKFMGHPRFYFQGWQFGEINLRYATKRTDIWGYFKNPRIPIKKRPLLLVPITRTSAPEWNRLEIPKWLKGKKISKADLRAITPAGFANAFYEANK